MYMSESLPTLHFPNTSYTDQLRNECIRFWELAESLQKEVLCSKQQLNVFRWEMGSSSSLHRGFYCPSPIIEHVIGNTRRGKLRKQHKKLDAVAYKWGFNENDLMVCTEEYSKQALITREHLIYRNNIRYGLSLTEKGEIYRLSEEVFADHRLISYTTTFFPLPFMEYTSALLHKETYFYNENGLSQCMMLDYELPLNCCKQNVYQFVQEDGYLIGYYVQNYKNGIPLQDNRYGYLFPMKKTPIIP